MYVSVWSNSDGVVWCFDISARKAEGWMCVVAPAVFVVNFEVLFTGMGGFF